MKPPVVLTIAGSDPSGSSGIQADLPTFAALSVHGTSAITVVTAQDSVGVKAFRGLPLEFIDAQIECLVQDMTPAATKTGLLRSAEVIEAVAGYAEAGRVGELIVDPVLVDSAGTRLVDDAGVAAYRRLIASASVITPNHWEAELLTGVPIDDTRPELTAGPVSELGCPVVVVTGGRGSGPEVRDLVYTSAGVSVLRSQRVGTQPIRGTGCTFSAALTALLARGVPASEAPRSAQDFVARQLAHASALQQGMGRPGVPHIH